MIRQGRGSRSHLAKISHTLGRGAGWTRVGHLNDTTDLGICEEDIGGSFHAATNHSTQQIVFCRGQSQRGH